MNYLLLKNVTRYVADKVLFEDISLGLNKGQKFALIAKNGTGKTTLLNIIAGKDEPDSGEVILHPEIKVGYLNQEPAFPDGITVIDALFADKNNPRAAAIMAYETAVEAQAESDSEANRNRLQEAMERMDLEQAWDFEAQVKQILGKLKVEQFQQRVSSLSGGQQKRLALARVLLQQPDLLILDEPTNHLDIEMIEWLEGYLQQPNLTLLLVTHDRYFLENICDELVELDQGKLVQFKGNYSYYLTKKAELVHNQQAEIDKARSMVRKEIDWIRRSPAARTSKNKARVDAFDDWQKKAKQQVKDDKIEFKVEASRMGSKILELKNVCKAFGDKVLLEKFTYSFKKFEKAGIAGKNGTGKSTLLNLITGRLQPDSGTIKVGDTIEISYFTQENPPDFTGKRLIDIAKDVAEYIPMKNGHNITASQFLTLFGFDPKKQYNYYETLSGGERRRLHLVTVLMGNPNFLILDEPTNDLDIVTLQTLEQFLLDFPGCVLIVSHDRFFMDRIVDHMFIFKGDGEVRDFPGNYSQYREREERESRQKEKEKKKVETTAAPKKKDKPKTRLGYMEKREFEQLGKDIEQLETRQAELAKLLESGETDYEKIMAWSEELEDIQAQLEDKEMRWLELSEYEA